MGKKKTTLKGVPTTDPIPEPINDAPASLALCNFIRPAGTLPCGKPVHHTGKCVSAYDKRSPNWGDVDPYWREKIMHGDEQKQFCSCGVILSSPVHNGVCDINDAFVCKDCNNVINTTRIELSFGDKELNTWVNDWYLFNGPMQVLSQSDQMTVTKIAYGTTYAYAASCGDEIIAFAKLTVEQKQDLLLYTQLIMYHLMANTAGLDCKVSAFDVSGFSMTGPVQIKYIKRVYYSVVAALISEKMGLYKPNPKVVLSAD